MTYSGGYSDNDVFTFTAIENIYGIDSFTLYLVDSGLLVDSVVITFTIINTQTGVDVNVQDNITGIKIIFSEITDSGTIKVEINEIGPEPPFGFKLDENYYNITTDSTYLGPIEIIIPYDESKIQISEENLRIFHWNELKGWTDVTIFVDIDNDEIYGEISGFSIFIILEINRDTLLWDIDQIIDKIQKTPSNCWNNKNNQKPMINKLIELKDDVYAYNLGEVYNKLLHDIIPKLTGLKNNEEGIPWGNGVFTNPWITCQNLRDDFKLDFNTLLKHIQIFGNSRNY